MKVDSSPALEPQTPSHSWSLEVNHSPSPTSWPLGGEVLFFSTQVSLVTTIFYTALQMQAVMEAGKAAVSSNYALIELAQC